MFSFTNWFRAASIMKQIELCSSYMILVECLFGFIALGVHTYVHDFVYLESLCWIRCDCVGSGFERDMATCDLRYGRPLGYPSCLQCLNTIQVAVCFM